MYLSILPPKVRVFLVSWVLTSHAFVQRSVHSPGVHSSPHDDVISLGAGPGRQWQPRQTDRKAFWASTRITLSQALTKLYLLRQPQHLSSSSLVLPEDARLYRRQIV